MKPLLLFPWIIAVCLGTNAVIITAIQTGHWSEGASLVWGGFTFFGLMIPFNYFIQK